MKTHLSSKLHNELIEPIFSEYKILLENFFRNNSEEISDNIANAFTDLLSKAIRLQQRGNKNAISFIVFSVFRLSCYTKNYVCRIDAYDEGWYADENECYIEFDISWIADFFRLYEHEVKNKVAELPNKIPVYVLEKYMADEYMKFCDILHHAIRYSIPLIEQSSELISCLKQEIVDIRFGEYFDVTYSLYKFDERILDADDIKISIKNKRLPAYSSVKNLDLSNEIFEDCDLSFCDFSGCNFEGTAFRNCNLIGTSWRGCNLESTNFIGSVLRGADFRKASRETAKFQGSPLSNAFW